jgi:hypothetical protein
VPHRRLATGLVALALTAPMAAALGACEPPSPDRASWRDDAYYATTGVSGDLGTATLALRELSRDRVLTTVARVAVIQAEDDAGKRIDTFGKEQPAPADLAPYHRVTSMLSDASDLLADVRIAVVRGHAAEYAGLLQQLGKQTNDLDQLSHDLGGVTG